MADLDEDFQISLGTIQEGKTRFSEDEQNIIDNWIQKFSEAADTNEAKTIRNNYARALARIANQEEQLPPPFNESPPDEDLTSFPDTQVRPKKYSFPPKKLPCLGPKYPRKTGAIPKTVKPERTIQQQPPLNEFEDPEEMAKAIARSKGQTFTEFLMSIARHTADFGQEMRTAMNTETTSFREYVDHVLSQRIKDLTEVLDEEQNRENLKIRKDLEKWQLELSNVKKRIKEMVPSFDIQLYKKDKNYLKKFFTIETPLEIPQDDAFERWKAESSHRIKWLNDVTSQIVKTNEANREALADIEAQIVQIQAKNATARQTQVKGLNFVMREYVRLREERDKLNRENEEILAEIERCK